MKILSGSVMFVPFPDISMKNFFGKLRASGIDIASDIPWGTHCCLLYNNPTEWLEILVPYFKAGLQNQEYCIWITNGPSDKALAKRALGNAMPDLGKYTKRGQIRFFTHDKWYLHEGKFNQKIVFQALLSKITSALAEGYKGLRISGDISWLDKCHKAAFRAYENKAGEALTGVKAVAVCSYPLSVLEPGEIAAITSAHQYTLLKERGRWQFIKNITSDHETRLRLRIQHEKKALCDAIPDPAWVKDRAGHFIVVNNAMEKLCGKAAKDIVGKTDRDIFPSRLAARCRTSDMEVMESGKYRCITEQITGTTGKRQWVQTIKMPVYDDARHVTGIAGITRHISERKQPQKDSTNFSRRLLQIREEEKNKVSAILHDEIGSMSVNLASLLALAAKDMSRDGGSFFAADKIARAAKLIKALSARIRNICTDIRPPFMEISGLFGALRDLTDRVGSCTGMRISFNTELHNEAMIPVDAKIIIYRIAQEAVNNAVKHSGAKSIQIKLWLKTGKVYLSVIDDGIGFDVDLIDSSKKFGLRIMKEEASLLGGKLRLLSIPAGGSSVRAEFPVAKGKKECP